MRDVCPAQCPVPFVFGEAEAVSSAAQLETRMHDFRDPFPSVAL